MPIYLVDRDLPGMTLAQLVAAQHRVIDGIARLADRPRARYLRCTFVPAESRVMCLFEAPEVTHVLEANEAAHFPFLRVVEAIDCPPPTREDEHAEDREGG